MAKHKDQSKRFSSLLFSRDKSLMIASSLAIFLFCVLWYISDTTFSNLLSNPKTIHRNLLVNRSHDPQEPTFYDDPQLSYTIDKPMKGWDEKRREWFKIHPTFQIGAEHRVLLLTGSQPAPCKHPIGDSLLLRCFKNKVDYCRIHGYDIFYNNALFNSKMNAFWAKIPLVRASMVAHPEIEWFMWMDSDAVFTDMEYRIPLERYKNHNFVVHGWPNLIYEQKSWVAANAGIFLIRNCQWSMDFLDSWAEMGPKGRHYKKWGQTLRQTFKDKMFRESDDQSALIYKILKEKEQWGDKIYVENDYDLHGYWLGIVDKFDDIHNTYIDLEKRVDLLRRRHAEAVTEGYGALRHYHLEHGPQQEKYKELRRPFITHFTGCQPCSGDHNPSYVGDSCWVGMERALNFADNQVLRNLGFVHHDIKSSATSSLPYNYPGLMFE